MSWSSGKDSATALDALACQNAHDIVALVTTFNSVAKRVAMHAVREELVQAQATALALPLIRVDLPSPCTNEQYEHAMGQAISKMAADGIRYIGFGDLFLEDVRRYRESLLKSSSIKPVFPLWKRNTRALANEVVNSGIKAIVTCVDPTLIPATLVGRNFDASFLADLPESWDPCGENGEFHTFVWDCPTFQHSVDVVRGEVVARDGFWFADLMPA